MKKMWIVYHSIMLLLLIALIVLHLIINLEHDLHNKNIHFVGVAIWISAVNIVIAMPIWIIGLLMNKRKMDKKSLGIGLLLFLIFAGLSVFPFMEILGYMYF